MKQISQQKAVIYCRVSSERQVKEGHGLDSQETSCLGYIKRKGYRHVKTFKDEGISGALLERPGMESMLDFLSRQHEEVVVVIDDLNRLARDVKVHWSLKEMIAKLGGRLESPNYSFGNTELDEFMETVFAAKAQLDRRQNRRQVIDRQKARLERGYWPFDRPPGYRFANDPVHGKLLIPEDPNAAIICEALEGFASDRFIMQTDVRNFLLSKKFSHRNPGKGNIVHLEQVKRLLTRVIYAGYIEYPEWDVTLRKGHHQGLITLATYQKIQDKLNGKRKTSFYHGKRDEAFPLRHHINCAVCGVEMTASFNTGRSRKYGNYRCKNTHCSERNVSIRKEVLEPEFIELLKGLVPSQEILILTESIAKDVWGKQMGNKEEKRKEKKIEIEEHESSIKFYLEKIKKSNSERVIGEYEKEIDRLSKEKLALEESLEVENESVLDFGTALEKCLLFLKDPATIWEKGDYRTKQIVPRLVFTENLTYSKKTGFGTASLSSPYALFEYIQKPEFQMVEMGGVEPPYKEKELA